MEEFQNDDQWDISIGVSTSRQLSSPCHHPQCRPRPPAHKGHGLPHRTTNTRYKPLLGLVNQAAGPAPGIMASRSAGPIGSACLDCPVELHTTTGCLQLKSPTSLQPRTQTSRQPW